MRRRNGNALGQVDGRLLDGGGIAVGRLDRDPVLQLERIVVAIVDAGSGIDVARLGVLGPTRMDYSNNMAAVRAVARYLSRLLGE